MRMDRRSFLSGISGAAALALTPQGEAFARAPQSGIQVPGLYRIKVGDFEITAISDGYVDLGLAVLVGADEAEAKRLLEAAFLPPNPIRVSVNAYAVNTGDKLVLVDVGTANTLRPTLGRLAANLRAAGIDPNAVDLVLATHLHADHVGGLLDQNGGRAFPNAEVMVHAADHAFWTSAENLAKAPDGMRPFFEVAQKMVKLYGSQIKLFSSEGEMTRGISAVQLAGHTPGHTGYRVASGNDQLLIWGDIVHLTPLVFSRPEWAVVFDIDAAKAVSTRKRVFDMVATDRMMVAGMHLPFPGIGHVARRGSAYDYVPLPWRPEP